MNVTPSHPSPSPSLIRKFSSDLFSKKSLKIRTPCGSTNKEREKVEVEKKGGEESSRRLAWDQPQFFPLWTPKRKYKKIEKTCHWTRVAPNPQTHSRVKFEFDTKERDKANNCTWMHGAIRSKAQLDSYSVRFGRELHCRWIQIQRFRGWNWTAQFPPKMHLI